MKPTSEPRARITAASRQGLRDHQEDRFVQKWTGTGWLLAVFDGHGGEVTAEQASQALVSLFEAQLKDHARDIPDTLPAVISSLHKVTEGHRSGSTASIVFIPQDLQTVHLSVLGDSPIALLDAQGDVHIGPEHNVRTNLIERAAAMERGGVYQAGYLGDHERPGIGLQVSRSLGDFELNRVLNREPEIQSVAMGGKGIVLIGSDGLLIAGDEVPAMQLTRLLQMIQQGADAEALVADTLARQTGDNVTAVVWRNL